MPHSHFPWVTMEQLPTGWVCELNEIKQKVLPTRVHRSCSAAARECRDKGDKEGRAWEGVSHHRRDLNLPARGEALLKDTQTREPQTSACRCLSHSTLALPGEAPAGVGRGWAERLGRLKAPLQEAKKKLSSSTPRQWASTYNLADSESLRHNWPTAPSGPWISSPFNGDREIFSEAHEFQGMTCLKDIDF